MYTSFSTKQHAFIDLYLSAGIINNKDKVAIINLYHNIKLFTWNRPMTFTQMLKHNIFPFQLLKHNFFAFIENSFFKDIVSCKNRLTFKTHNKVFKVFKIIKKYQDYCSVYCLIELYFQIVFKRISYRTDCLSIPNVYNYGVIEHDNYVEFFIEMEYITNSYCYDLSQHYVLKLFDIYPTVHALLEQHSFFHYDTNWFYNVINSFFFIKDNSDLYGTHAQCINNNNTFDYYHIYSAPPSVYNILNRSINIFSFPDIFYCFKHIYHNIYFGNSSTYESILITLTKFIIHNILLIDKCYLQTIINGICNNTFINCNNSLTVIDFEMCGRLTSTKYNDQIKNIISYVDNKYTDDNYVYEYLQVYSN